MEEIALFGWRGSLAQVAFGDLDIAVIRRLGRHSLRSTITSNLVR
jgi:hypothetical protein